MRSIRPLCRSGSGRIRDDQEDKLPGWHGLLGMHPHVRVMFVRTVNKRTSSHTKIIINLSRDKEDETLVDSGDSLQFPQSRFIQSLQFSPLWNLFWDKFGSHLNHQGKD